MKEGVGTLVHLRKTANETDADGTVIFYVSPYRLAETPISALDHPSGNECIFQHDVREADSVSAFRRRIPPLQNLRREVVDGCSASANFFFFYCSNAAKNGARKM